MLREAQYPQALGVVDFADVWVLRLRFAPRRMTVYICSVILREVAGPIDRSTVHSVWRMEAGLSATLVPPSRMLSSSVILREAQKPEAPPGASINHERAPKTRSA